MWNIAYTVRPPNYSNTFVGFGAALATADSRVIASGVDDEGEGLAVVFDAPTGAVERVLVSPAASTADFFGYAVAADDQHVAVTAPGSFSAYVFDYAGQLVQTIVFPVPQCCLPRFGRTVAIDGDILAIGGEPREVHLYSVATGERIAGVDPLFPESVSGIRESTFGENAIALSEGFLFVGDEAAETIFAFGVGDWQPRWVKTLPFLRFKDVPPTGLSGVGLSISARNGELVVGGTRRRSRILGYRLDGLTGVVKRTYRGRGGAPGSVALNDDLVVTGTSGPGGRDGQVSIFRRSGHNAGTLGFEDATGGGARVAIVDDTVVVAAPQDGEVYGLRR